MVLQVHSVAVPGVIPVEENRIDGPDVASVYIPGPAGISVLRAAEAAAASASGVAAAATMASASAVVASDAADAAILSADGIYASTGAGLAGVASGRYFYIVSSITSDALDLYLNNSGTADYKKTIPASAAWSALERVSVQRDKQPNLFTPREAQCVETATFTVTSGEITTEFYGSEQVYKLTTNTGTGTSRFNRQFLRTLFGSATSFSAAVTVAQADVGSSGSFQITQKTSGGSTISSHTASVGGSAYTTATVFRITDIAFDANCAYLEFSVLSNKTSGDKSRVTRVRDLLICAGSSSYYRAPGGFVQPNFFPDPEFYGVSSTAFPGVRIVEGDDVVLDMSGTGTRQTFYQFLASGVFAPGARITALVDVYCNVAGVGSSADAVVIFYDSTMVEISRTAQASCSTAGAWESVSVSGVVPDTTAYIVLRFVARAAGTTAKWRRVMLQTDSLRAANQVQGINPGWGRNLQPRRVVYVATTGSDNNDGSEGSPFATIQAGVSAALPNGMVFVRGGDYAAGFSVAGGYGLEVSAYPNERVRILLGLVLSGWSKTAGYSDVYQCALAYAPGSPGGFIWEHEIPDPDSLISISDRLPAQRGQQYGLPSTRLEKQDDIAAVDAAAAGAWYWDGSATVYIRTPDGTDPAANGRSYYVPSQSVAALYGGTGGEVVTVRGLESWYSSRGWYAINLQSIDMHDCFAFGSRFNGGDFADTQYVRLYRPRVAGSGNDGHNAHNNVGNPDGRQLDYISFGEWSAWNWDDGQSYHENGQNIMYGGLWEYNGDRGVATSYGCHTTIHGGTARYNGRYVGIVGDAVGEGFTAISVPSDPDTGIGTQIELINCQSYGNNYNYRANGTNSKCVATGCISRDAVAAGYRADTNGLLQATGCYSDSETAKSTATGGSITVTTISALS